MTTNIATLRLLLSPLYRGSVAPEQLADLRKSVLTDETIHLHRLRSVPPAMISRLLGFDLPGSALLIPFPHPEGGFMAHVRMKVFPSLKDQNGHNVKYLQLRRSAEESSDLLSISGLTSDQAQTIARAKWEFNGEVVEVRPRRPPPPMPERRPLSADAVQPPQPSRDSES